MAVPARKRRRGGRRIALALGLFLFVLVAAGAWVGVRGLAAKRHLTAARAEVPLLRNALLADDRTGVSERLAAVQRETAAARRLTSDPVWRLAEQVPFAGRSLETAGGLAGAVDDLARQTLPELDVASRTLALKSLRPTGDRIALEPLAAAREPLRRVRDSVRRTEDRVRLLPSSGVAGPVAEARTGFLAELASLRGSTETAVTAVEVAPAMLGRDGKRRYFLAILNNAEMRGSGGLLGAYGILEADRGRLRMRELGTNATLRNLPTPAVDLGPEFAARYDRFATRSYWVNANMSPHFPSASRIWTSLWARTHGGERLDGTIAVDPVGLAAILRVTGPAPLPGGGSVTAANVVELTEREAYERFRADNDARDAFLQEVARAAYLKAVSGAGDTAALVRALASAAGGRHVQVASERSAEAALLSRTPLAGELPTDRHTPYLEVLAQNAGGNKLDYYVRRDVRWARDGEGATVQVRLRNDAPPNLPPYVSNRLDLPGLKAPVPGQQRLYVSVYGGVGGGLLGATLDGRAVTLESEVERGHPVFSLFLDVDPGAERVLVLRLREPAQGPPVVRVQPVVVPDRITIVP
ncbi:MAG TPA: DUF4012 domain-containing protein [Frankiaceae bacterium]|nr:DUF4012 domain-containing protein [Frankiaceae bacterium]